MASGDWKKRFLTRQLLRSAILNLQVIIVLRLRQYTFRYWNQGGFVDVDVDCAFDFDYDATAEKKIGGHTVLDARLAGCGNTQEASHKHRKWKQIIITITSMTRSRLMNN